MKNFSSRIRILRDSRTLSEFSKLTGINLKTYQHYESGSRKPNIKAILQIAAACSVSADWLLGLTDYKHSGHGPPVTGYGAAHAAEPCGSVCAECAAKETRITQLLDTLHNLSMGRSQPARTSGSLPVKY